MRAHHLILLFAVLAVCGCGTTKSRKVSGAGMYTNTKTGFCAIGKFSVLAIPDGEESASIGYEEDTAWLSPTTKTHKIDIMMTGTNSVEQIPDVVMNICNAFSKTAKVKAEAENDKADGSGAL